MYESVYFYSKLHNFVLLQKYIEVYIEVNKDYQPSIRGGTCSVGSNVHFSVKNTPEEFWIVISTTFGINKNDIIFFWYRYWYEVPPYY